MWIVFRSAATTLIIPFGNLETVYVVAGVRMTEHRPLGKFFSSAVSVTKHNNSACNMTSYFVAYAVRLTKAISPDSSKPDQLFLTGNIQRTIPKICVQSYHDYSIIIHSAVFLQIWGNLRLERNAPSLSQFPKDWLYQRLKNYVCR